MSKKYLIVILAFFGILFFVSGRGNRVFAGHTDHYGCAYDGCSEYTHWWCDDGGWCSVGDCLGNPVSYCSWGGCNASCGGTQYCTCYYHCGGSYSCGSQSCNPAPAAGTCPTACHSDTQYVPNGSCGSTTCSSNAPAAGTCPTACGQPASTVPDGSCGTTSCAATASCCTPETDSQFCSRLGKNCDNVTANNNCGTPRTVNCGSCTDPQTCGGGGTANVCGCTAACSGKICGVANGCGGTCDPGSGCTVTGALTVATTPTTITPLITLKDSGSTTVGTGNGPSKSFTIPSGTYSITYGSITDYDSPTPNPKAVTFDATSPATVTGNYTAQPGTLAVRTTPFATIKVDGVSWNYTPQTRPISAGFHTVTFGALAGYDTPGTQTVEVKSNKTTTVNVNYVLNSGIPLPTSELQLFEARYTWREVAPIF